MRDYDDTVKALRCCAGNDTTCDDCPRASEKCIDSIQGLLTDAADAIEELIVELTTIRKQLPHWISVEERLPERYETVLLNIQTCKDSYVTIGDYEPNELRFRDFADRNNHVYCGDIVTHWMPLPAPPKGVE